MDKLEPEIAQLRGYIDKKRRNAALTEVATKVSRRGTSCLAVRTSLQSAKSGLAFRTHSNANVTGLFSRQRLAREGSTEWRKRDSLGSRILTACAESR